MLSAEGVQMKKRIETQTRTFLAHFPWYTCLSLVVYSVFFGVQRMYGRHVKTILIDNMAFDTDKREDASEIWRYYTHSLIHASPSHYALNIVCLLFVGTLLEVVHGFGRAFVVSTMCVLHGASGMAWENRLTGSRIIGIGASGGMYGVVGAHGGDLLLNWKRMNWRWFRLCWFLCFLLCDTIASFYAYDDDISYSGHLGGFLAGVLGGPFMLASFRQLFPPEREAKEEEEEDEHDVAERGGEEESSSHVQDDNRKSKSKSKSKSSACVIPKWSTVVAWTSGGVFFLYTFFGALNAFGGLHAP